MSSDEQVPQTGMDISDILQGLEELGDDDAQQPAAEPEEKPEPQDEPESESEPEESDEAEPPTEDEPEPAADKATKPEEPLVDESLRRVQYRARLTDDQLKAMPPEARVALLKRLQDDYAERDKMAGEYGSMQQRLREKEQQAPPQPPVPGQPGQGQQTGPFELLDIAALQREYAEEFGDEAAKRLIAPHVAQNKVLEYLNQQHALQQQQAEYQRQQQVAQLEQQIEGIFAKPGMAELFGSGPTTQVDPEARMARLRAVQQAKFLIDSGVAQSWEDAIERARFALFPNTVTQPPSDPASDPAEEQKAKVRDKRRKASTPRPNAPQGASAEIDPIDEVVAQLPPEYR